METALSTNVELDTFSLKGSSVLDKAIIVSDDFATENTESLVTESGITEILVFMLMFKYPSVAVGTTSAVISLTVGLIVTAGKVDDILTLSRVKVGVIDATSSVWFTVATVTALVIT